MRAWWLVGPTTVLLVVTLASFAVVGDAIQVIPPEGFDFEQDEWRRVMDLQVALERDDFDADALDADVADAPGNASVAAAVREEFDVPDELSDADAEAVLPRALSQLADGDADAATALLADEFESVCESQRPALDGTDDGSAVACHLYEDAEAEPVAESERPQ